MKFLQVGCSHAIGNRLLIEGGAKEGLEATLIVAYLAGEMKFS